MTRMNTTAQKAFQNEYLGAQEHMSSEAVEYVRGISVVKVFQQTIFSFKRFYDSIIAYRDLVTKYTLGWQKPMSLYFHFVSLHPAFVNFMPHRQANNCFTKALIALPSALPANCFVAVPITCHILGTRSAHAAMML